MCNVQLQPCLILFLRVWVLFAPLRRGSWNPTSLNSLPEIFSSSNMICPSFLFTSFTIRCITPASQLPSALNVEVWSLSTFGIVRPRRDPLAYETNDPDLYSVEHPPHAGLLRGWSCVCCSESPHFEGSPPVSVERPPISRWCVGHLPGCSAGPLIENAPPVSVG